MGVGKPKMTEESPQWELPWKHVKQIPGGGNSGVVDPVLYQWTPLSPSSCINDLCISMKLCTRLDVYEKMTMT